MMSYAPGRWRRREGRSAAGCDGHGLTDRCGCARASDAPRHVRVEEENIPSCSISKAAVPSRERAPGTTRAHRALRDETRFRKVARLCALGRAWSPKVARPPIARTFRGSPMPSRPARTIHFVSLGCVKNRVDTEVMLGVASAVAAGAWSNEPDDGRGHRRQHLRLHRRGQERVDRHHLRARRVQEGTALARSSSSRGACRSATRRELAAQMPEVDHFLGSSDMLKLGTCSQGTAERMLVGNPADWVDPRQRPASRDRTRARAPG